MEINAVKTEENNASLNQQIANDKVAKTKVQLASFLHPQNSGLLQNSMKKWESNRKRASRQRSEVGKIQKIENKIHIDNMQETLNTVSKKSFDTLKRKLQRLNVPQIDSEFLKFFKKGLHENDRSPILYRNLYLLLEDCHMPKIYFTEAALRLSEKYGFELVRGNIDKFLLSEVEGEETKTFKALKEHKIIEWELKKCKLDPAKDLTAG